MRPRFTPATSAHAIPTVDIVKFAVIATTEAEQRGDHVHGPSEVAQDHVSQA